MKRKGILIKSACEFKKRLIQGNRRKNRCFLIRAAGSCTHDRPLGFSILLPAVAGIIGKLGNNDLIQINAMKGVCQKKFFSIPGNTKCRILVQPD